MSSAVRTQSEVRQASWATGARALAASPTVQSLGALLLYLGFALWLTWPMPRDPSHILYGGTGDPIGSLAHLREILQSGNVPFLPGTVHSLAAPEGLKVAWIRSLAALPSSLFLWSIGSFTSAAVAYNALVFVAYPATGIATFLLVRRLTGSAAAAFVCGWAFAFFPYAVMKGHGHYELAHGWPLVLLVWRMLELDQRASVRNGLLAGATTVLAMAWTPYYILICGVLYTSLALVSVILRRRRDGRGDVVRGHAAAAAVVLVFLGGFYGLTSFTDTGQGLRNNNDQQLNTYSARPYEYVIPNADNPVVGESTGPWLTRHLHGSNASESTLYLGLSILALAVVGLVVVLRGRAGPHARRVGVLMLAAGFVALALSGPPQAAISGHLIPLPSKLITEVSTTWRVFARFVEVIMLTAVVLAGYGIATVMQAARRPGTMPAIAATAVVAVVVAADLWPQAHATNPLGTTSIYAALRPLPPGVVAEYPIVPSIASSYDDVNNQDQHAKPILGGYDPGSLQEQRALQLDDPSRQSTVVGLASLGVRYVVVRNVPSAAPLPRFASGFRLIAQDGTGRLYRVAPPAGRPPAAAFLQDGFLPPERDATGEFQWLQRVSGVLKLNSGCRRTCSARLQMTVGSFGRPRVVVLRTSNGRLLARRRVAAPTRFDLPVRLGREAKLSITASPGPQPASSFDPATTDRRSLALQVRTPRVVVTRAKG